MEWLMKVKNHKKRKRTLFAVKRKSGVSVDLMGSREVQIKWGSKLWFYGIEEQSAEERHYK